MRLKQHLLILSFLLLVPLSAGAHGSGASFERVMDGVLIDIGYSPEEVVAGTPVPFDFAIYDAETSEEVPYTDIWVRVHRDREAFFAGGIRRSAVGATTMLYQFPEAGEYALSVRFQNAGETVAETTFEISVLPRVGESDGGLLPWGAATALLGGLLVGGIGGWMLRRTRTS